VFLSGKPRDAKRKLSLRAASGVRSSFNAEGMVLLHIEWGRIFRSNQTGAYIWKAALDGQPAVAIAQALSTRYHVPIEAAERHIQDFLGNLRQLGLLTLQEDWES
jgi:hypothetical protein